MYFFFSLSEENIWLFACPVFQSQEQKTAFSLAVEKLIIFGGVFGLCEWGNVLTVKIVSLESIRRK